MVDKPTLVAEGKERLGGKFPLHRGLDVVVSLSQVGEEAVVADRPIWDPALIGQDHVEASTIRLVRLQDIRCSSDIEGQLIRELPVGVELIDEEAVVVILLTGEADVIELHRLRSLGEQVAIRLTRRRAILIVLRVLTDEGSDKLLGGVDEEPGVADGMLVEDPHRGVSEEELADIGVVHRSLLIGVPETGGPTIEDGREAATDTIGVGVAHLVTAHEQEVEDYAVEVESLAKGEVEIVIHGGLHLDRLQLIDEGIVRPALDL